MFERIARQRPQEERLKIRQGKEIPIIDELINQLKGKLYDGKILPKSKLREAMGCLLSFATSLYSLRGSCSIHHLPMASIPKNTIFHCTILNLFQDRFRLYIFFA